MANSFRKLYLLVWKNFILQIRRPIGTAVELILPIGFLALLILAREKIERREECLEVFDKLDIQKESRDLFGFARKLLMVEKINVTRTRLRIGYYPNDEKVRTLLQSTLPHNLMLADVSVAGKSFSSKEEIIKDAKEFRDKYLGVIVFKDVKNGTDDWPKVIRYSIRLHHSTGKLYRNRGRGTWQTKRIYNEYVPPGAIKTKLYHSPFLSLQYYIDSAIISYRTGSKSETSAQYVQQYPYPAFTRDPFVDMVAFLIPLMIVLAFIYTAQMVVKDIVSEKEHRLTESMKMMGLPGWVHWTAWFIKVFAQFLLIIILQTLEFKLGKIFEFSHAGVIFVTLLLWSFASIQFLFLISSFCSFGTRGMVAASTLWFGSFAPYMAVQNPSQYEMLSKQAKQACCLLPNTCLGIMVKTILGYEGEQIGIDWNNMNKPVTIDDDFSLGTAFIMLILDSLVFMFFRWYIENVFPGEYGIPKPFYFPFQPSYWCNTGKRFEEDVEMVPANQNFEEEPSSLGVGVRINHLRKVFSSAVGKKVAVDDLTLNVYKGQITALLGHNGAGKTTTLSILTGLFPPSKGDATFNGKSIRTDMDEIRDSLGLCPQHNVLFDRLTVKEHLQFFSALKGVSKSVAEIEITKMIADLQLVDKTNEQSSTLSGGMKRKLSCAIALIGGTETVILDEPTSGMDPYARRATWDLLQRYRGNKTIILTTHFMDEADYLGDRIAIMAEGAVRCCGSSLFLKKRFGVGYHLTLVKSPEFQENQIISTFNNLIPSAKMVGNIAAEMSYVLQEDSTKHFHELFQKLEDDKASYGITSFGVSVTTLEEVFLKVGEGDTLDVNQNVAKPDLGDKEKLHSNLDSLHTKSYKPKSGLALRSSQFKAMFLKRLLNSIRQKKALVTQLLLPIGLLLLGFLLSSRAITQQNDPPRTLTLEMLKGAGANSKKLLAFFSDTTSDKVKKNRTTEMASLYYSSVSVELKDVSNEVENIILGNHGDFINISYSKNLYSGTLQNNNKTVCCNYQYLVLNLQCFNATSACSRRVKRCKLGDISSNTSYLQEYVLEDSDKNIKKYFRKQVAGMSIDYHTQTPVVWYSNQAFHTLPSAYSAVSNIILKQKTNQSYGIITENYPLPRSVEEKAELSLQNWGNMTLVIFLLFGCCALAASFITFLIDEKVSKAKHVQFVSGVNAITYWLATYCWDILNFLVPAVGFMILFAIFNLDDYKGLLGHVFVVTLLFGLSMLPFVYLLSFLFTSSMAGYGFIGMLVELLSLAMYLGVFICDLLDLKDEAHIMHHVFLLFPTYAYPMALNDMVINHSQKKNCEKDASTLMWCEANARKSGKQLYQDYTYSLEKPGIGYHCLYMGVVAVLYFLLVLLTESNFFLGHLFNKMNNKVNATNSGNEDSDVMAESQKIHSMNGGDISNYALVMKDLTKVYRRTGMVAVDHLNIGIPKGECFGLLGVNGAGKTSTFGMLTGDLGITEGKAFIHGFDIQTELKYVQQLIGYCPQFDALVGTMTGREVLRMFAQLRGIDQVNDVVTNAIRILDLQDWADKLCGTYSGGNKRKLSTAIALVGNPPVVFLDEPTSGMDPGARRHLWNTLSDILKSGKSIVLTSHSMEECEALCTRLVIMVNGKFKCVGSVQHLKSRFGQGYTVMLKISSNNNSSVKGNTNAAYMPDNTVHPIQNVKGFMEHHFPGALLMEEHQGLLQYQIVDQSARLSQIFGILESNTETLGIIDYSVCQTSLEQVFINFAKFQHAEDRIKRNTCSCSCF